MKIVSLFNSDDGNPGGSWIVVEAEFHLGEDIVVPDHTAWQRETMPGFPDAAYRTIAPDWVREALSPSTRRLDPNEKRDFCAREGIEGPHARNCPFGFPTKRVHA